MNQWGRSSNSLLIKRKKKGLGVKNSKESGDDMYIYV